MKKLLLILLLFSTLLPKNIVAQDNDAMWGAIAVGAAAAIAIEDNNESLERIATDYIFSNHPEYNEFRLKVIGWGDGAKRISDKGTVRLCPFELTELKNNMITENRKLLLMFASYGWVNEFGLDYTKISWQLWSTKDWNKLLSIYSVLNSPNNIPIIDNQIPVFDKYTTKFPINADIKKDSSEAFYVLEKIIEGKKHHYNKLSYIQDTDKTSEFIGNLKFTKLGWKLKKKTIYPFYQMDGDDYIIKDYSESLKIFTNENALGLFLKDEKKQMLIKFSIVNKIHKYLNNKK
tara:strand:+ start:20 stop:889 length:870 start_codon:yes stop_codon:yes gene_type:complete